MLNVYLFIALLVVVFGMLIPVDDEPNIVHIARCIRRSEDGWHPWGELASIFIIAALWLPMLVLVIALSLIMKGLLKDG